MNETYMLPTRYYALNASEKAALEAELAGLAKRLEVALSWVERTRLETRAGELQRRLRMDEVSKRQGQRPAQQSAKQSAKQPAQRPAQHEAEQSAEPIHKLVCARGFRAISERPDGSGSILIVPDEKAKT